MTEDLERRLQRMGTAAAPGPDPTFVSQLQQRLRAIPLVTERRPPLWTAGRILIAAGAAAAVLVVLAVLSTGVNDQSARITAATGGDVELPGGSVVPASPGQKLPEGAIVRTGPSGSIQAGDTDLGPDEAAVVRDGKVVPTSLPPTTRPSSKSESTTPTRPSTTAPTTATRPPADAKPAPMRIEVRRADGGVMIHWSIYDGRGFDRYVVLRRDDGEPVYGDPATRVVAEIRDRAANRTGDREPVRSTLYRVVAIDAGGRVIAASPVARVPTG